MNHNPKKHGHSPYNVVVVHGGPGAPGSVEPVARELSKIHGVLEPYQTADSVDGQISELKEVIKKHGTIPVTLVGHSWGAFLCWIVAAQYPDLVQKLVLVGCGVFEKEYAAEITHTRLSRLGEKERKEVDRLLNILQNPSDKGNNQDFSRLGKLLTMVDICQPIELLDLNFDGQYNIFAKVWPEAEKIRNRGKILAMSDQIKCPVVAIHGDCDSHPPEGVDKPLKRALKKFKFYLLKDCGHYPWLEKFARKDFFDILNQEIK